MTAGLAVVLVLLCAVGALMGFRDAPNAAALPVRYRALTPRGALLLTGAVNTVGALLGIGLITLSVHYFTSPAVRSEIGPLAVGVSCAVTLVWGLLLWWRRLPGSSTHALISALAGSHLAVRLSLHIDVAHTIFDLVRAEVVAQVEGVRRGLHAGEHAVPGGRAGQVGGGGGVLGQDVLHGVLLHGHLSLGSLLHGQNW